MLIQKIAAHGLIRKNGKYLVTRRSKINDYKPGEWDIPGGTIEFGEDPVDTLKREVFEETGLKIKVGNPLYIYSYISDPSRHQFQIVYQCEYAKGEVLLNPEEHDQFKWVTFSEMDKLNNIAFLKSYLDYKDN